MNIHVLNKILPYMTLPHNKQIQWFRAASAEMVVMPFRFEVNLKPDADVEGFGPTGSDHLKCSVRILVN